MTSTTNTVSSDISKIAGVTLNLKRVSTDDDGETSLRVEQDSSALLEAVKNFVSSYNDAIGKIETVTASGADLQRDSSLISLKNTLRNYANGSNNINGGTYSLLSQLGIKTSEANSGDLSTETYKLTLDESAFMEALENDPSSVEFLLGDDNGILGQMENTVEMSLKAVSGYFDIKTSSFDTEITRAQENIIKQQEKISTYRAQLEKKFSAMESLISQMQQNFSYFFNSSTTS